LEEYSQVFSTSHYFMPKGSLTKWGERKATDTQYTGQELKRKDPERYAALVRGIKEGVSQKVLSAIFSTNQQTIAAIAKREDIEANGKAALLNRLKATRDALLGKMHEAVENGEMKGKDCSVPFGIVTDKILQIEGQPSTIVEHRSVQITSDSLKELLEATKREKEVIDAEVVEPKSLPENNHG